MNLFFNILSMNYNLYQFSGSNPGENCDHTDNCTSGTICETTECSK